MRILRIVSYILLVVALILVFINWKYALSIFLFSTLVYIFPTGLKPLLNVLTGYLLIAGIIYLFVDWRIGIVLILLSGLTAKLRIWSANIKREKRRDYYRQSAINERKKLKEWALDNMETISLLNGLSYDTSIETNQVTVLYNKSDVNKHSDNPDDTMDNLIELLDAGRVTIISKRDGKVVKEIKKQVFEDRTEVRWRYCLLDGTCFCDTKIMSITPKFISLN